MTLMATPSNLRSMIPMNRRGRMSVSYSSVHDYGSIHIRFGSNLPLREVLATFILGIQRLRLGIAQMWSKSELKISNMVYCIGVLQVVAGHSRWRRRILGVDRLADVPEFGRVRHRRKRFARVPRN